MMSVAVRYFAIVAGCTLVVFAAWCAFDSVLVSYAPSRTNDFGWTSILFPVIVLGVSGFVFRRCEWEQQFWLSVSATVFSCIATLLLIGILGIQFHLSIGGTL